MQRLEQTIQGSYNNWVDNLHLLNSIIFHSIMQIRQQTNNTKANKGETRMNIIDIINQIPFFVFLIIGMVTIPFATYPLYKYINKRSQPDATSERIK